jgi:deoxyribonuclease V
MWIAPLHRWPRTPRAAVRLQQKLAPRVELRLPLRLREVRLLAGVDAAFSPDGSRVIAGVVVWDCRRRVVLESRVARRMVHFPYVPGLLSFRESPAILAAIRALRIVPQVFLCDGQGLAHPRRFGLACHLGLWLGCCTVGCAKSRLCGVFVEPGPCRGDHSPLTMDGRQVGDVLRTRDGVRPLFVSPGHLCDLRSARELVLLGVTQYRLPEPTRLAHQLVTRARAAGGRCRPVSWRPKRNRVETADG